MFRTFVHTLLRPVMRLLSISLSQAVSRLPIPIDAPHAHASGTDPDRILLYGSGPACGYGVLSHDLALPGQLARQISAATGRGVDLDVVSDSDLLIDSAVEPLKQIELWRYDAFMITVGPNDALLLIPIEDWRRRMTAMIEYLIDNSTVGSQVYIVAVPLLSTIDVFSGMAGWLGERHANRMNLETKRICARFDRVTFVPFSPLVRSDYTRYRSAATYQQWAGLLSAPVISDLGRDRPAEPETPSTPAPPSDEMLRQEALNRAQILDTASEERFDRIAVLATQLFGSVTALITFVDHDRQWIKAASESPFPAELPRHGSFADYAIASPAPFVVEDARADARFALNPRVTGDPFVRFYAGYPIESPFGERIGVICVLDHEPRTWSAQETVLLRDLALMVQKELSAG